MTEIDRDSSNKSRKYIEALCLAILNQPFLQKETKNLATKCPQYAKPAVKWALSFIFQQAAVSNIVVMQFPTILDTVNMMNDNREIQLNR